MWAILKTKNKIFLTRREMITSVQLWDEQVAIQNPEMKTPYMLEMALKQAKRKLDDLQQGPNEAEVKQLLAKLKAMITS